MPYTFKEKLDAIERELKYRRRVYARRVEEGKMSQQLMDDQIKIFEEVRDDYAKAEAGERLF